ncbi:hypothetical protein [Actinomadura algeriensis]|uniref:Uncharacterized protein n=1 Tax=Actinomadura algeriensis TaxID=1679523 RepID=A0ABR9JKR8_9ACTN|nr:hypothetical protein [Actinomadura algeriensis]MBE1531141.1 hypothetical protein [Actinomadura algeriensis]
MNERTERAACPAWCTGTHRTGIDGATGAYAITHTGPDVTAGGITVTISLTVAEGTPAFPEGTLWPQVRATGPDGFPTSFHPDHVDEMAAIIEATAGTDAGRAVRQAAAVLQGSEDEFVRASVPGTWPGGEPATVRAAEDEHQDDERAAEVRAVAQGLAELLATADRHARLADEFRPNRPAVASALDLVAASLRALRAALGDRGGVEAALDGVAGALGDARTVLDAHRAEVDEQDRA